MSTVDNYIYAADIRKFDTDTRCRDDFNVFDMDFKGKTLEPDTISDFQNIARLMDEDELIHRELEKYGLFGALSVSAYARAIKIVDGYGRVNGWEAPNYFDWVNLMPYPVSATLNMRNPSNKMLPLALLRHIAQAKLSEHSSRYTRPYWHEVQGWKFTDIDSDWAIGFLEDRMSLSDTERNSRAGHMNRASAAESLVLFWELLRVPHILEMLAERLEMGEHEWNRKYDMVEKGWSKHIYSFGQFILEKYGLVIAGGVYSGFSTIYHHIYGRLWRDKVFIVPDGNLDDISTDIILKAINNTEFSEKSNVRNPLTEACLD